MSTLFVWREKLRDIYAKYSTYILKALQLILGLVLFGLINVNIGFMEMASSVFCTVGLAVICTFFPMIVILPRRRHGLCFWQRSLSDLRFRL